MKKSLLILGLAVVGTGMLVKKLRNKKNNEVEENKETVEELAIDSEEEIEIIDCENIYVPEENKFKQFILKKLKKIGNTLSIWNEKLNDINEEDYDIEIDKRMLVVDSYKKECKRKIMKIKMQLLIRGKMIIIVRRSMLFVAIMCKKIESK